MTSKALIGAVALVFGALGAGTLFAVPVLAATDLPIPGTSYGEVIGGDGSGTDAFGNPWLWSKTAGPKSTSSPGKGYSVWGTPGLDDGNATYKDATPATDFGIVFYIPFSGPLTINETPSNSVQNFTEWTRFETESAGVFTAWTPVYISPQQVDFLAPTGVELTDGEQYFVNVVFNQKNVSGATNTGFNATFSGNVPEASTWAMLGVGFAGIGLLGMTKRRKASRYAL